MGDTLICRTFITVVIALAGIASLNCSAAEPWQGEDGKRMLEKAKANAEKYIYLVRDYSYLPATETGDKDDGLAFCGTRCNAFSTDYQTYMKPGWWRIVQVGEDVELTLETQNPLVPGKCRCVADKYLVKANELYMSK